MSEKPFGTDSDDEIRRKAEAIIAARKNAGQAESPFDLETLVHELSVQQVELELQNASLRNAQQELEAERRKYFELYDLAPVGYIALDLDNYIREINNTGALMLGGHKSDLLGARFTGFVDPDSQDAFYLHEKNAHNLRTVQHAEITLRKLSGVTFHAALETVAVSGAADSVCGWRTSVTDITARVRAMNALRQSENRLRLLLEQAPCIIWTADAELRITSFRGSAFAGNKITSDTAVGKKIVELIRPENPLYPVVTLNEAALNGKAGSQQIQLKGKAYVAHAEPLRDDNRKIVGVIGVGIDVTGQKKAETELKLSEEKYRTIVDNAPIGISVTTPDGRAIERNRKLQEMFGYSSHDEFMKVPVSQTYARPEDRERFLKIIEKGPVTNFEVPGRRKDGTLFWESFTSVPVTTPSGEKLFISMLQDITEKKKTDEELKWRAMLVDAASDAILLRKYGGKLVYANEAALKLYGYARDEMLEKDIRDLLAPGREYTYDVAMKQLREKGDFMADTEHVRKDGSRLQVEVRATLVRLESGEYILTVTRDTGLRKQVEEELKLRAMLLDKASDAILLRRLDESFIYTNEAATSLYGYTRDEFAGISLYDLLVPERRQNYDESMRQMRAEGGLSRETVHRRKDGTSVPVDIHSSLVETGSGSYILTVVRDISRRKQREEELTLRAKMLDNASDAIMLRRVDGNFIYTNAAATRLYGYGPAEFSQIKINDLLFKEPASLYEERHREMLTTGKLNVEAYHLRKDGQKIPVEARATLVNTESGDYVLSVVRDISERKNAEDEIRLRATLLDAAHDAIMLRDPSGRFVYANGAAIRLYGYDHAELLELNMRDLIPPENLTTFEANQTRIMNQVDVRVETTHRRKDGSLVPVEAHAGLVRTPRGDFILSVVHDITDRRAAENALKKSEEKYRSLVRNAPVGIVINTVDGRPVERNIASLKMHGYTSMEEFNRIPVVDIYADPEERKRFIAALQKGVVRNFETRHKRKDGSVFWISITSIPYTGENGEKQVITISQDIDERKKIEEALKTSEESFRNLVENLPVGVAIVTRDGRSLFRNRAIAEQSGYTREELQTLPVQARYYDPADRDRFLELTRHGVVRNFETRLKRKDESFYWGSLTSIPQKTTSGDVLITIIEDISERKRVEEELRELPLKLVAAQEKERRAIGRELHDQTGQYLTGLKLLLAKALNSPPDVSRPIIEEAYTAAGDLLKQVREMSLNLRPPMLDDLGSRSRFALAIRTRQANGRHRQFPAVRA